MGIRILIFVLATVNFVVGQLTKEWMTENIIQADKIPQLEDSSDTMFTLRVALDDDQGVIACGNWTDNGDTDLIDQKNSNAIICATEIKLINHRQSTDHWSSIRVTEEGPYKYPGSLIYGGHLVPRPVFTGTILNKATTRPLGQAMHLRIQFHRSNFSDSRPWRIQWTKTNFSSSDPFILKESNWTAENPIEIHRKFDTNNDVANYTLNIINDSNQTVFSKNFEFFETALVRVLSPEQYFHYHGRVPLESISSEVLDQVLRSSSSVSAVDPKNVLFQVNKYFIMQCTFCGYPFSWKNAAVYWKPGDCTENSCVEKVRTPGNIYPNVVRLFATDMNTVFHRMTLLLKANQTGAYFCGYERNGTPPAIMFSPTPRDFVVADSPDGTAVFVKRLQPSKLPIIDGQRIVLEATVNRFRYKSPVWRTRKSGIEIGHPYNQDGRNTSLIENGNSLIFELIIENATLNDSDHYWCEARRKGRKDEIFESNSVDINVKEGIRPYFGNDTYPRENLTVPRNSTKEFICDAKGVPDPKVDWIKNGEPIDCEGGKCSGKIRIEGKHLTILHMEPTDAGRFMCRARSILGVTEHEFTLSIDESRDQTLDIGQQDMTHYLVLVVSVSVLSIAILAVAVAGAVFAISNWWEKAKSIAQMKKIEDQEPSSDAEIILKEDKPINQQAHLFRFFTGLAIADDRIQMKQSIGSGAFGSVYQGYLLGDEGERVLVAIKKPKDSKQVQQFSLEIKLMQFLPYNLNVLSLLGVMSKSMSDGKVGAVLEFCDFCLLKYVQECAGSLGRSESDGRRSVSYVQIQEASNSIGSQYVEVVMRTTVEDLLKFSYQIACGMEYLISKNVIHRDIALRNILLRKVRFDDMDFLIVKVADFGLARHEDWIVDNQKQFPFRWTALEALEYGQFGWESDVWSFGVVLWELFSMGQRLPYAIFKDKDAPKLKSYLKSGNRLEKPKDCPEPIYNLMKKCWSIDKTMRPTFGQCKDDITKYATSTIGIMEWQQYLNQLKAISKESRMEIEYIKENIRSWNTGQKNETV